MKLTEIRILSSAIFIGSCFISLLVVSCDSRNKQDESQLQKKSEIIIPSVIVKNVSLDNSELINGKVVYSVVKDVSFSKSGKLEIGDIPLVTGSRFKFNENLINLNIEEAFKELAQSKLSFSKNIQSFEEQIEKKVPSELIKWRKFEADLTPSKRLPEFPTIYTELEKALIIEYDIFILFSKIKNQESEIEQYFYLAPFDGIITAVFKKKNENIQRNQTVIKIAKNDVFNAEFVVSKTDYEALKKLGAIDFLDKDNNKIGSGKIKETVELNSDMKLICSFRKTNGKEIVNDQVVYIASPNNKKIGCYLPKNAVKAGKVYLLVHGKEIKKSVVILEKLNEQIFVTGLQDGDIVLIK